MNHSYQNNEDYPYNKMFRFIVFIHKALQLLFGVGQVLQFGHSKCFRYLFQPSRNVEIEIRQECKCLSEKNKNYQSNSIIKYKNGKTLVISIKFHKHTLKSSEAGFKVDASFREIGISASLPFISGLVTCKPVILSNR